MNKEELININGIREDLYQAMQIGDITLNSKHSQKLYDFMNYQDKEIERLNNIKNEVREYVEKHIKYECDDAFNGKQFYSYHLYDFDKKELLGILDKEVN